MKSTKKQKCALSPSDCGVWLDASELRAKKLKKPVPISKLLNPLARAGGYSTAVALSFTQTKMQMPQTKQSTISSFFLPQSKLNKEPDDHNSSHPLRRPSTSLTQAFNGAKRKRDIFELASESDRIIPNEAEMQLLNLNAELESKSDTICMDHKKKQQFFNLIWGYQLEEQAQKRPGNSRMFNDSNELENTNETSEDSGVLLTEHSKVNLQARNFMPTSSSQESMNHPVWSQDGSELADPVSYVVGKNKENSRPNNTEFSSLKHHHTVSKSPSKHNVHTKDLSCGTPTKLTSYSVINEEDSLGLMFTQDSEGFCVIANRSQLSRCPLKDQTNLLLCRNHFNISSVRPCETEPSLEPDMLFTQDSQGNMVIKH